MECDIKLYKHFTWLRKVTPQAYSYNENYQDRLSRLERDKELLILQVSMLTNQVKAQGEKICNLESSLEEHHFKLYSSEVMLQQELLSTTALDSQKLDLLDEVSYLKLRLVDMEEKYSYNTEKQHKAESEVNLISDLQEQMQSIQQDLFSKHQEKKVAEIQVNGNLKPNKAVLCESDEAEETTGVDQSSEDLCAEELCCCRRNSGLLQELKLLQNKVEKLEDEKSQYEKKLMATKAEITSLQHMLQCKNAEIENLQAQLLSKSPVCIDSTEREELYRRRLNTKHQELQKLKAGMELLTTASDVKDRRIEELSLLLRQCRQFQDGMALLQTPQRRLEEEEQNGGVKIKSLTPQSETELTASASSAVLASTMSSQNVTDSGLNAKCLYSSIEDLKEDTEKAVTGNLEQAPCSEENQNSQSIPQNGKCSPIETGRTDYLEPRPEEGSKDEELSPGKTKKTEDTSASAISGVDSGQQFPVSQENMKNNKSIVKLWGKRVIRRTQSGGLKGDVLEPSVFKRGGFRATAGPRLARTSDFDRSVQDRTIPFCKWSTEQVCGWLEDSGLSQYVNLARQWVLSGQTLLSATPQEFEKEMGIKQPLHRKKLQLALRSFNNKAMEKSSELDHIWVTCWLDDIGLPQYKDQFNESRVDGRMLQYLTVNDLLFLKVTSQLHHLSIKCAIHVLHANKFNPYCLRRRPGDENKTSPFEVVQWSNHRVMEWLRAVDLAEYAPNLRGSGVHGGLVILEPRFSSETLAMLLNIPPQKTLLRRHLSSNFNTLVGVQVQQEKQEYASANRHSPLITTAKVRPKKLSFTNFSHLKKRRPDDSADYICPVAMASSPVMNSSATQL